MMKKLITPLLCAMLLAGCYNGEDEGWTGGPVIPVTLKGIEAVNVDNSGELPKVATGAVKRDSYMVGIKWEADNLPGDDDAFVGDPIQKGEQTYSSIADGYSKRVRSLTQYNSQIKPEVLKDENDKPILDENDNEIILYPNVSIYFMEADRAFIPEGVDEGLVLVQGKDIPVPDEGTHIFRVEYWRHGDRAFYYDLTVELK
jgi:hypothetical protein